MMDIKKLKPKQICFFCDVFLSCSYEIESSADNCYRASLHSLKTLTRHVFYGHDIPHRIHTLQGFKILPFSRGGSLWLLILACFKLNDNLKGSIKMCVFLSQDLILCWTRVCRSNFFALFYYWPRAIWGTSPFYLIEHATWSFMGLTVFSLAPLVDYIFMLSVIEQCLVTA